MATRSRDRMSPRIYPWWLILVGFVIGVFVTLVVTSSSHPAAAESSAYLQGQIGCDATTTAPASDSVISPSVTLDPLLIQATQMVMDATRTAEAPLRARCATAQALDNRLAFLTPDYDPIVLTATAINRQAAGDDPILMTATAIVIQATLQAPR